ncbi:MAG: futalosine hydrolase [Bacteroidota bacterium]
MKILLVVATEKELDGVMQSLAWEDQANQGHEIETLITGVGMVATAFWTGKTLQFYKPDLAVNIGIAGSFDRSLAIGEVVNIMEDCFSEMGAQDGSKFLTAPQISLLGPNDFPYHEGKLMASSTHDSAFLEKIKKVKGITVNTVHGDEQSIAEVVDLFNPDVESMEGAAFFYTCRMENIPCLQIRAVSNYVEKRNRDNWNIPLALENLAKAVKEILIEL